MLLPYNNAIDNVLFLKKNWYLLITFKLSVIDKRKKIAVKSKTANSLKRNILICCNELLYLDIHKYIKFIALVYLSSRLNNS